MTDTKKYYYLRLKENFFESDELIILEAMPDGFLYSNILLKLYLRSLKNNGKLMVNSRIPYNSVMLSKIVRQPVAVVEKAIQVFKSLGLIEIMDNGFMYMLDIQNFIGRTSNEADRKREYRDAIVKEKLLSSGQMSGQNEGQNSDKSAPEIEIELEKEIETKKDKEKKKKEKSVAFSEYTTNKDLLTALNDFLDMRKKIKAPMTARAISLMLSKLDTLSQTEQGKIAVLNQSIMNSWKGIFAVKEDCSGTGIRYSQPSQNPDEDRYADFERAEKRPHPWDIQSADGDSGTVS